MTLTRIARCVALTLLTGASGGCNSGSLASPDASAGSDGAAITAMLRAQLEGATSTWASAKLACTMYSYDRRFQSVFGWATSTQVQIENDVADLRRFSTYDPPALANGGVWRLQWEEGGTAVGSHDGQDGAYPAYSVEQLLSECATVLAQDPATYDLTLQIDAPTGVPTLCLERAIGCADDCDLGIRIAAFVCTPLSANGPS